ncbi:hypothetical protein PIB30_066756 [Stylosanthes scabra]|uniref:Ubiquitin-like protease family profile domain-containing protein n=1 Tax=Stylosanthes scabra TaxID=79078 RepID=A0ABU6WP26_9FABA|nr:hypothetical protein [Stylosanthes scabra]
MGKKAKDKGKEKEKEKVGKSRGSGAESSRELPTVVEEEVSVVDNQILGYLEDLKQTIRSREETLASMLHASTTQVQITMTVVAQQGRSIEALTEKIARLELHCKTLESKCVGGIPVVDVESFQPRDGVGNNGLRSCKRKLEFVTFSSEDMNILYSIKQQYVGSPFAFWSHNRTEMLAEETPNCPELAFRPPAGMRFVGTELAVAAYIFANAGEENERLYQDAHCDGSRFRLRSLILGEELYDDVLNMVVGMCFGSKRDGSTWWLPTTFSQMIVSPPLFNQPTMNYIKDRYMGLANDLKRIYIPMHIGRHWYLMLINIWGREIVHLDSQRSDDERETSARVAQMMEVSKKDAYPSYVTDYEPLTPDVGYQAPGS